MNALERWEGTHRTLSLTILIFSWNKRGMEEEHQKPRRGFTEKAWSDVQIGPKTTNKKERRFNGKEKGQSQRQLQIQCAVDLVFPVTKSPRAPSFHRTTSLFCWNRLQWTNPLGSIWGPSRLHFHGSAQLCCWLLSVSEIGRKFATVWWQKGLTQLGIFWLFSEQKGTFQENENVLGFLPQYPATSCSIRQMCLVWLLWFCSVTEQSESARVNFGVIPQDLRRNIECFRRGNLWMWRNLEESKRGSRIWVRGAQQRFDPKGGLEPKLCSK